MRPDILFSNAVIGLWSHKYLLTQARVKSMINALTLEEAARILLECNYDSMVVTHLPIRDDVIVENERTRTFNQFIELCGDKQLRACIIAKYDYHNAKVLLGNHDAKQQRDALYPFAIQKLDALTSTWFNNALQEIRENAPGPVETDNIVERALYREISSRVHKIKSKSIRDYFRTEIDLLNIRTAMKCRIGESELTDELFVGGGHIEKIDELKPIVTAEIKALPKSFKASRYKTVIDDMIRSIQRNNSSYFDNACDEYLFMVLDAFKGDSFTANPLFYWFMMKQLELKVVKIILMSKRLGMDPSEITKNIRGQNVRFKA